MNNEIISYVILIMGFLGLAVASIWGLIILYKDKRGNINNIYKGGIHRNNMKINSIIGILAFVILVVGGIWIYSIVNETNEFQGCVTSQANFICHEAGYSHISHEVALDFETMIENPSDYKIICFDNPNQRHVEIEFKKSDIIVCNL